MRSCGWSWCKWVSLFIRCLWTKGPMLTRPLSSSQYVQATAQAIASSDGCIRIISVYVHFMSHTAYLEASIAFCVSSAQKVPASVQWRNGQRHHPRVLRDVQSWRPSGQRTYIRRLSITSSHRDIILYQSCLSTPKHA